MTSPQEHPDGDEMSLVMPFVLCRSAGGPYDDAAFTAGYECGLVDQALTIAAAIGETRVKRTVRTDNLPQLDLIAMRHGFAILARDSEITEWTDVAFTAG